MTRQCKKQTRFSGVLRLAVMLTLMLGAVSWGPTVRAGAPPHGQQLSVLMSPADVNGGSFATGTVTLSHAAPHGGAVVLLTSSSAAAKVPASVTVPEGSNTASFAAATSSVTNKLNATITATYKNFSATASLTVEPSKLNPKVSTTKTQEPVATQPPQPTYTMSGNSLANVFLKPSAVNWGGSATGTVALLQRTATDKVVNGKLQKAKPVVVLLSSNNSLVKVPASVTMPKGGLSASFPVTISKPSTCSLGGVSPATAVITAKYKDSRSASLQIGQSNGKPSRYTSKTIGINPNMILGVSHDAHALILDGADKCVQSLAAGDVVLFKKLGVLEVKKTMKISSSQVAQIRHTSGGVAVAVSSASFTDFINDGTFQVFKSTLGDAAQPSGPWAKGLEPAQPVSGDGDWKYKVSGTGSSYSFLAYKQNGGLQASVSGNGQITKFGFNFLAVIHQARLQQATFKVDTNGTLDLDWMAQTTASGQGIGESRLRLPALHSGLVDSADDVPLLYQVYANLIFKPGFGEKAAAKGHFRVIYSGEGGIDGTTPLNEGLDAKTEIASTTSSAKAAHGAVVAVNAPKFALSLSTVSFLWALDARMPGALNSAGASLADSMQGQLGTYVKADLMPPTSQDLFKVRRSASVGWVTSVGYAGAGMLAMFPCQQYYQTFLTLGWMDKDMLGSISGSIPGKDGVTIFKKTKTTIIPLIKGCEPKT